MNRTQRLRTLEWALRCGSPVRDATGWAKVLDVDMRTVQRYIRILRQEWKLRVVHDPEAGGYRLSEPCSAEEQAFELPGAVRRGNLLRMVRRLEEQPGILVRTLAEDLGCCERTIYRYRRVLEEMGLPLVRGGYRLSMTSFLPPLELTGEELLLLMLGIELAEVDPGPDVAAIACRLRKKIGQALQVMAPLSGSWLRPTVTPYP